MSSTRSIIAPPAFAANALTVIPPTPVAGVSYRDPVAGPISSPDGWPYAERVNSAEFNQIMYQLSSLLGILDKKGVLGWSSDVDYSEASVAFGSDGKLYSWLQASGPTLGGARDPVTNPLYWSRSIGGELGSIQGAFKNMYASCTGLTAVVTFTAEEITLRNSAGNYLTRRNLSLSASTGAASGVANSLDTGAWANSTWYFRHVIYNPATGVDALLWSLSRTSPVLPSGFTFWAYTGQSERTQPATNFNPLAMQWNGHRGSYIKGGGGNVPFLPVMATGNQGSPVVPTYIPIAWAPFAPPDTYELDLVARVGTATAQVGCAPNNNYLRPGDANQSAPTISHLVGNSISPLSIRQMIPIEGPNIYYTSDDATYSLLQCCGFNTKG